MSSIREQLDEVLRRRGEYRPVVEEEIDRWTRIGQLVATLGEAAAPDLAGEPDPAQPVLGAPDTAEMAAAVEDCLGVLATVRARVNRGTVNIGVSGRARNGKSTVLQALSGLDDRQIPSGRGQPVTAVRSRIYHSATDRGARLRMHTAASFLAEVIAPYHAELGLGRAPQSVEEFARHGYGHVADGLGPQDKPRLAPVLARLQEAQEAVESYRPYLTGETRTVDLTDIRQWVAYPEPSAQAARPYLAVRDAAITCAFPLEDLTALGLVDMPGLGELVPRAEEHHLDGLRNDIDFVIVVKRPTDTNSMWAQEDARALQLIGSVCTTADVRDFALVLVNTGGCLPENIAALQDDLDKRLNNASGGRGYWVVAADGADRDAVRDQVLRPVLEHLALALPRMDRAAIEDAVRVCEEHRERIAEQAAAWAQRLRAAAVPTSTEQSIARAEELRAEVAASVQGWVDTLKGRAADDFEDTEFYERITEVHQEVRAWVLDGFGQGADAWRQRALNRFRVDRASLPFASAELNRIRVEMARRFSAVDSLLSRRRDEYWAGLAAALGPRLTLLVEDTAGPAQHVLSDLAAVLRDAPEPCPELAETLGFALDVRLDYRTRALPRVRRALEVLLPEPDDPAHDSGPATLLSVPRTDEGAGLLLERITQLARQAAYDAQGVLAQEPGTTAQVLFAYGEQFEDAFVRAESSEAEFRRLVAGFQDRLWPGDRTGPQSVSARVHRLRHLVAELRRMTGDARVQRPETERRTR
ncbi:hypothetical protein AB0D08_09690 [Kitasatospora sp. NPDC048540]|uniref:hypothetical protein n=1 Tax=Kitasatospora sp. NPDC048540 TaxID=3155634 RepID=UPI003402906A